MSYEIGRVRSIMIAAQPTFGVPATTGSFALALTGPAQFTPVVTKIQNTAALGSDYAVNDIEKTTRHAEANFEFKLDEDLAPLLFKQRFAITSVTGTEAGTYVHSLTFQNGTNSYYTLFLQDDLQQDYVVSDFLFDNHDITMDNDFVRFSSTGIGRFPTATAVTNVLSQPKEFVGRMVSYQDAHVPGTATATLALAITANIDFGLNSEDTRFALGSEELAVLRLTADTYMFNVSKLKSDTSRYDDYTANTMSQIVITAQSTDRFVASSTGTRPTIVMSVPRAKYENYTEEADLNELTKENFDLTALKPAAVNGTPMTLTITNATSAY